MTSISCVWQAGGLADLCVTAHRTRRYCYQLLSYAVSATVDIQRYNYIVRQSNAERQNSSRTIEERTFFRTAAFTTTAANSGRCSHLRLLSRQRRRARRHHYCYYRKYFSRRRCCCVVPYVMMMMSSLLLLLLAMPLYVNVAVVMDS